MEQTISNSQNIPSSTHKSFSKTRKKKRYQFKVQCLQTTDPLTENPVSAQSLLQTPSSSASLQSHDSSKQIHAQIIKSGGKWMSCSLTCNLIQLCLETGDTQSAAMLFSAGLDSGSLSLSYLTDAFDKGRVDPYEFLRIFQHLHRTGSVSNVRILTAAIKISAELGDSWLAFQSHALIAKSGLDAETLLKCYLMDFYAEFFSMESTEKLFRETPVKCDVLWNKAVMLNAEKELWWKAIELFREMQSSNVKADEITMAKILNSCGRVEALRLGKQIHGHVIRSGLLPNLLVSNSLITMYSKNSSIESARRVFESIPNPSLVSWNSMISCCSLNGFLVNAMELFNDMVESGMETDVVTWNCLISGHSLHGFNHQVFELFRRMQFKGLKPNSSTITSVLRAVSGSNLIKFGKEIHGCVMRNGLECNVYTGTSLVDMYLKCCSLSNAHRLFDTMKHRNVITWNSLITGYAYAGFLDEALQLLKRMENGGLQPNIITWNALISGYSMKGQSRQALVLIRQLKSIGQKPNVVSWTAIISGCCQNEQYEDSLYFFTEMQKEGIKPNSATLATVLRACSSLALLNKGEEIHCFATRIGLDTDIYVATSLIDMYSKSGSLRNAYQVFKKIENKNLASWNAMIMGFAVYGQAKQASLLFDEMSKLAVKPDGITFTALLSSCRHSGLITEGWKYFDGMKTKYGVVPRLEHYTSIVDLLARWGYLDEALDFIQDMPLEPDASLWGALLGACRTHRNLEIAEIAARNLFKLEPHNCANYLLMMSLYAYENRWEDAENMRNAMNAAGLKSKSGWSWIQIGQTVHVFSAEGKQHEDIGEIYFELYQLISELKKSGYVPDTSCIVRNVREEAKEKLLMAHTEKLAITYGLINTSKTTMIRVITNTRVCNDCHTMAKCVSKITGREIYLRDGVRFHHFIGGECSCNNYW
ncbi:uncharacterized protein A4U43_C01F30210 [Asparagus officinalis]|uniref:DYW domain-containing protein n=1 Tax=Asparagus officinalis TaxID=4686 RepID=A0A5P1FWX4_ASPOF|nr:pentatricopeptide repeat-containing protein At4g01030, mitochondrial [Asparagus officinalis]ONK81530.1 uncharacterized protein A4U43_C01F30210 [Asparagus officinalis]